jgi:hypothetical protein
MFKYTIATAQKLVDTFKKIGLAFRICLFVFSIAYYIVALIAGIGNFILNSIFLGIMVVYAIFDVSTIHLENKELKKTAKRAYSWIKLILRGASLVLTLINLYTAASGLVNPTIQSDPGKIKMIPILIVGATLTIIFWLLSVIVEIVKIVIAKNIDNFKKAIHQDFEDIKKPVTTVTNVFKKMTGKDIEEEPEKPKFIKTLDKFILKKKQKKKEERDLKKQNKQLDDE